MLDCWLLLQKAYPLIDVLMEGLGPLDPKSLHIGDLVQSPDRLCHTPQQSSYQVTPTLLIYPSICPELGFHVNSNSTRVNLTRTIQLQQLNSSQFNFQC